MALDGERVTNVRLWLMTIGGQSDSDGVSAAAALTAAGGRVESIELPTDPSRSALDAALDTADGRRVVIHSSIPDLARVLRRMMRRSELTATETAVLPRKPVPFLARYGIADLTEAAAIAVDGRCLTVGVLKDDSGHVVVDHAELAPWSGSRLWVRAYVDDDCLADGEITRLRIDRGAGGGLRATAWPGGLHRRRAISGRGLTLACDDAAISSDGAERDQPRRKRIWWDEPEQWRLAVRPT